MPEAIDSANKNIVNDGISEVERNKGGVAFVFDRVMHYHVETLREVERRLNGAGIPFHVLSAQDRPGRSGRVAESGKVVHSHKHFKLTEQPIFGFQFRYQHGLMALLEEIDPTVVVSMCHAGTVTEWQMLNWAGRQGVRRVAWQCGYEYNPGRSLKRMALDRFVPRFDFHLCYHTNAQKYAQQYGASPSQTLVMHNTIDERRIIAGDRAAAKEELAARYPQLAGKELVLYVGAVLEEKRLEVVFDALVKLNRPDAYFVVVGDGPHLATLKQRYADRTDWLAAGRVVEGVGLYFDAADVFVLPGTGGLAINEAMAHRLPVISGYADGSADDLVVDGVTGYRLQDDSAETLACRLNDLLDSPERARAMGAQGEMRIRGELSFASFIERVVGVLVKQHALAVDHAR